jgi:hypothetical protein
VPATAVLQLAVKQQNIRPLKKPLLQLSQPLLAPSVIKS